MRNRRRCCGFLHGAITSDLTQPSRRAISTMAEVFDGRRLEIVDAPPCNFCERLKTLAEVSCRGGTRRERSGWSADRQVANTNNNRRCRRLAPADRLFYFYSILIGSI